MKGPDDGCNSERPPRRHNAPGARTTTRRARARRVRHRLCTRVALAALHASAATTCQTAMGRMDRNLTTRIADELLRLPAAERRAALAQIETLLRDHGMHEQVGSCRPGSLAAVITGALVFVLLLYNQVGLQGASSGDASMIRHAAPHHGPHGVRALDSAPGCHSSQLASRSDAHPAAAGGAVRTDGHGQVQSRSLPPRIPHEAWHRLPRSTYPVHGAFDHPRDALQRLRSGRWNTSSFPLILCIGQGKTATKSLNKAFVMLGMNTAHFYGAGVYGLLYDNAAEASAHSFFFNVNEAQHVNAVLDTPVVDFYNEILLSYPRAKVILTVREPGSWLRSQQKFYGHFARSCRNWLAPWRRGSNLVYGTECPSKEQAIKRYVMHNRNVYDSVPPERLLVMDIPAGDGWEKLCPFLGLTEPHCPPTNLTLCRKAGVDSCVFPSRK